MISVLIVDDHNIVRIAIKNMLGTVNDITVVGEAETGEEGIKLVRELKPDVVLMDIQMPGMGGLAATQRLLQVYPKLKIIVLTAHQEEPFPYHFVQAGAAGYLTKNTHTDELIAAIRQVFKGHSYITPGVAHLLVSSHGAKTNSPMDELSKRELQVMLMILKGDKIKDIAEQLNLSVKTISTYRTRIFGKLHIKNDVELTHLAMRYGILDGTQIQK